LTIYNSEKSQIESDSVRPYLILTACFIELNRTEEAQKAAKKVLIEEAVMILHTAVQNNGGSSTAEAAKTEGKKTKTKYATYMPPETR
jgi:hypothetical protein